RTSSYVRAGISRRATGLTRSGLPAIPLSHLASRRRSVTSRGTPSRSESEALRVAVDSSLGAGAFIRPSSTVTERGGPTPAAALPLDLETILASVGKTSRFLVEHSATGRAGSRGH